MQVKKFRAATTREALEKIKHELGDDAFVLETKQVRAGGLLGFKSEMQVEISAAAAPKSEKSLSSKSQSAASANELNLTDNTLAAPFLSRKAPFEKLGSSRFHEEVDTADSLSGDSPLSNSREASSRDALQGLEITTEAPRIVHTKKERSITTNSAAASSSPAVSPVENRSMQTPAINQEFERLRAEMREIKFTLGAVAARQSGLTKEADVSHDSLFDKNDSPFYEAYLELIATGMSSDVANNIIAEIHDAGGNQFESASEAAYCALLKSLPSLVQFIQDPLQRDETVVMAMVGATGVGKTTTIAKLAARVALRERRRVELITLDTYRIAAVEQLKTYAEIIGAGCHVVRSTLELDAILSRLSSEATVLIDTTGRNPNDLSDQYELSDYLRHRDDILKCLVLPASTHPDDSANSAKKFNIYNINCLALSKLDETSRPGANVQVIAGTHLPLVYLGTGQRVPEDLEQASPESFAGRILPLAKA